MASYTSDNIPEDVRDLVMMIAIEDFDCFFGTALAVTCKREQRRYQRLVPLSERLILYGLIAEHWDLQCDMDCYIDERRQKIIFQDDRAAAHYRKKYRDLARRMWRREFMKPMQQDKRRRAHRARIQ